MRKLVVSLFLAAVSFAPGPAGGATLISHHPRQEAGDGVSNLGWSSSNWSGYAVSGSSFTSATGSWIVQKVSASHKATYSSQWVGIDGFTNSSLIQTGTESDF